MSQGNIRDIIIDEYVEQRVILKEYVSQEVFTEDSVVF
ncbi:hypothetical protein LCGC14_1590890 [marine sediment metagenome]|uniref:Uncharacterized protein n=1 Tax=marine sediment metagenome TaxID=412755 RepID=A0A0F9J093_9ZZZZ